MNNEDKPTSPCSIPAGFDEKGNETFVQGCYGLTKLEYLTAKAMQALVTGIVINVNHSPTPYLGVSPASAPDRLNIALTDIGKKAVMIAEQTLKELENETH